MKVLAKIVTIAAGLTMSAQPCLAAAANNGGASLGAPSTASAAERVDFDLKANLRSAAHRTDAGTSRFDSDGGGMASLTLAASQQTASETEDRPRRRGSGTTTWLIIGGVVLLAVIAAAVASAAPTPGPHEGAFD